METTVRIANQADISAIFDIRTSVTENHLSHDQLSEMGITPQAIREAIQASPCVWVAEVEGVPVGFSMADAEDGCVFAAFVRPGFEGCGLGSRLMARAEEFLFQHHRTIWLETAENSRASGFYRSLGWQVVEKLPEGDVRFEKSLSEYRPGLCEPVAGKDMVIRLTHTRDWMLLKHVRLAALLDAPTAFGVSHETAANDTDAQWKERASSEVGTKFWLALKDGKPVGMIGAVIQGHRYNVIAMWVAPDFRGSGAAAQLVGAVKRQALQDGHEFIYLDVSADNARASSFYLKHGFVFMDEWETLASHPHIKVQTMTCAVRN